MPPLNPEKKRLWRRILQIELWLCVFPPWGLWELYQDPLLSPSTKWRMVVYTYLIPTLIVLALDLYTLHRAERAVGF